MTGELQNVLSAYADQGLACLTVIMVQIVKLYLPSDPSSLDKYSVDPKYKKHLLSLSFVVGIGLSLLFAPSEGKNAVMRLKSGLYTGGMAVVVWEAYSNWVRPFLERK